MRSSTDESHLQERAPRLFTASARHDWWAVKHSNLGPRGPGALARRVIMLVSRIACSTSGTEVNLDETQQSLIKSDTEQRIEETRDDLDSREPE